MTKPRIKTGNREEVIVLCRLIGALVRRAGNVIVMHSLF
jgi:hypothetical protein